MIDSTVKLVSVIIPAYNASDCIERAINSVFSQTFTNYEIIIIDDGSTDITEEIVKKFGDKVRYIRQEHSGTSAARNNGIEVSNGDWISFLDADDEWLPEKLELQIELINKNPDLKWCSSYYYLESDGKRIPYPYSKRIKSAINSNGCFDNYFKYSIDTTNLANVQTTIIKKDIFDELGKFEVGRIRSQDLDMWWRIAHKYPKIGFIAKHVGIKHLDFVEPKLAEIRHNEKRGFHLNELITRHLELARKSDNFDDFVSYIKKLLRNSILPMAYNGFSEEARLRLKLFKEYYPLYLHASVYLLTISPRFTAYSMSSLKKLLKYTKIYDHLSRSNLKEYQELRSRYLNKVD
jgi:glycosyltransferase involved in cell wall biosynthesis